MADRVGRHYSGSVPLPAPFSIDEPTRFSNVSEAMRPAFVDYWERTVPWTFRQEKLPYFERRRLRYDLQDYMAEAIPFALFKGKRVLEIGSGSGIDLAEFGTNGAQVVGLDFTETGATSTKDTLSEAGVSSSDVVRAVAQALPFRDDAFDCVYSFGVLHHIPDVSRPITEVSRVLTPGGDFIFMMYNRNSLLYAYSIVFLHETDGLSEAERVSRYSERIEGCPYTRAYTKDEIKDLLGGGFHVATQVCFNVIDAPEHRKVKVGIPDGYELGWHLIAKAKKALDSAIP